MNKPLFIGIFQVLKNLCFQTIIKKEIIFRCSTKKNCAQKMKCGFNFQTSVFSFRLAFVEVHSNAFRVKFDREESELGYVCPTWIDLGDSVAEDFISPLQTNIILPFKDEIKQRLDMLYSKFDDIHPSILLFLHRLKCVIIENKITKKTNVTIP